MPKLGLGGFLSRPNHNTQHEGVRHEIVFTIVLLGTIQCSLIRPNVLSLVAPNDSSMSFPDGGEEL